MDEMNNYGETQPDELNGKCITIPLKEYYHLLNDNSILTAVKNSLNEMSLKEAIGDFRQRNREEALTRYEEQRINELKEHKRYGQN